MILLPLVFPAKQWEQFKMDWFNGVSTRQADQCFLIKQYLHWQFFTTMLSTTTGLVLIVLILATLGDVAQIRISSVCVVSSKGAKASTLTLPDWAILGRFRRLFCYNFCKYAWARISQNLKSSQVFWRNWHYCTCFVYYLVMRNITALLILCCTTQGSQGKCSHIFAIVVDIFMVNFAYVNTALWRNSVPLATLPDR